MLNHKQNFLQPFVWNKCFKRKLIVDNGVSFDEERKTWEDNIFFVFCLNAANELAFIHEALIRSISSGKDEHLSSNYTENLLWGYIRSYEEYKAAFGEEYYFNNDYTNNRYFTICFDIIQRLRKTLPRKQYSIVLEKILNNESVGFWVENVKVDSQNKKRIKQAFEAKNWLYLYLAIILNNFKKDVKKLSYKIPSNIKLPIKKTFCYFKSKNEARKFKTILFNNINKNSPIIIGTPAHNNIGDSAIAIAEKAFLLVCGTDSSKIAEITDNEVKEFQEIIIKSIKRNNSICFWHGGGNFGDQWFDQEKLRRECLSSLGDTKILFFPQTIYYTDTETGKREKTESIQFYNDRSNLTLVAREKMSEFLMKELYPKTEVLLTPDIVLSTTMDQYGVKKQERNNVMFCVRADAEKRVDDSVWNILEKDFNDLGLDCFKTDMHSVKPVTKENRADRVREKMQEFCGARLVVTDRLHGMIFAALTGTPCIVFSNYNHKVKGTYDFISYLPYIKYAVTVEQAESYIPELLEMHNCEYDNEPLKPYFNELKKKIVELTSSSIEN